MSSINKILNAALSEGLLNEDVEEVLESKEVMTESANVSGIPGTGNSGDPINNQYTKTQAEEALRKKLMYGSLGVAGIGAGLGALALVKRMRAKAAAAKKKAKKKA